MPRTRLHLIVGITVGMVVGTVHALVTHASHMSTVAARTERAADSRSELVVVEVSEGVFIVVPVGGSSGRDRVEVPAAAQPPRAVTK